MSAGLLTSPIPCAFSSFDNGILQRALPRHSVLDTESRFTEATAAGTVPDSDRIPYSLRLSQHRYLDSNMQKL